MSDSLTPEPSAGVNVTVTWGGLAADQVEGEVELLAVMQDTAPPQCAGVISAINHWYDAVSSVYLIPPV